MKWEVVIGLETHAQLTTKSKIFSGASTRYGALPNTQASAIDLALPGTLPVLNKRAVELAIRFGLAVGGAIAPVSAFERKNYFYPDLPKGYQISQYLQPIVSGGQVAIVVGDVEKVVQLTRAHLEEDAGKSLHEDFNGMTGIDLNRAGTPLLEIVTEPVMESAEQAVAYAKALHSLVRWIGICDGNMQEGSFRCDANVSVRRAGEPLGTRCEIKNLNSFRFLEKAIEYEVRRQVEVIEDGGKVVQETRLFDPDRGETRPMRSKEDAQDYRYFPDPDLLPVQVDDSWIAEIGATLGELPASRWTRYRVMGMTPSEATTLTASKEIGDYYDTLVEALGGLHKLAASWMIGEFSAALNRAGMEIHGAPVSSGRLAGMLRRIDDGTISGRSAKEVFDAMWEGSMEADAVIESKGLRQISDVHALTAEVEKAIAANQKLVEDYRAGKDKAFNALVGQVMKATKGKGNPQEVNRILRERLAG